MFWKLVAGHTEPEWVMLLGHRQDLELRVSVQETSELVARLQWNQVSTMHPFQQATLIGS